MVAALCVALIVSAVSSTYCLRVIWVSWSETGKFAAEESFGTLLNVHHARTRAYRFAWCLALLSLLLLVVGVLLYRVAGR